MENREPWSWCETPDEKCTMNYCDENGCQNRKRVLVPNNPNMHIVEEPKKHEDGK